MGKKTKIQREARMGHGDEILEGEGIDLTAPDEELLPRLLATIGNHPDADLSIADNLGSILMEEAVQHLVAWDKKAPQDKDLRRVIRSSLFRLSQRGVAGASQRREEGTPVQLVEASDPVGYLSPLDGAGNRLTWLVRPRAGGGFTILSGILHDQEGMKQIDSWQANKSQFREALEDIARRVASMVEAPHRYVDWLMYEAHRRGAPRDEPMEGYPLLRSDFYTTLAESVISPVHAMMNPSPADAQETLCKDSEKLFSEREFQAWALSDDLVTVHQARFRDAQVSTLVLDDKQMQERLSGIIDRAFEEVFQTEARALYAGRMEAMALWFLLARRQEAATKCYAVHLALADQDRSLQEVSFLRGLTLRAFLHLMPRSDPPQANPADPSSLIVTPD